MNIGFYSGTFDPIHKGHILFAETVASELSLDFMYVLAEPKPWRKKVTTDSKYRQDMVDLSFESNEKIKTKLDGLEDSFNVRNTLNVLRKKHKGAELTLALGADEFLNIDKWDNYNELFESFSFAVALRTEDDGEELLYKIPTLPESTIKQIVTDLATVSSSKIKQDLDKNKKYLDNKVYQYIIDNKLYL